MPKQRANTTQQAEALLVTEENISTSGNQEHNKYKMVSMLKEEVLAIQKAEVSFMAKNDVPKKRL